MQTRSSIVQTSRTTRSQPEHLPVLTHITINALWPCVKGGLKNITKTK